MTNKEAVHAVDVATRNRSVVIMSAKSSGSSVLQRELSNAVNAKIAVCSRHYENETLFWTKAASILGWMQHPLPNSAIPLAGHIAKRQLTELMRENIPNFDAPLETEEDIFAAWSLLTDLYGPVFLEKSPHHLYQPEVVRLMMRYATSRNVPPMYFVGLIRNPIDTFYSSWRRFGTWPDQEEPHWCRAYQNLYDMKTRYPDLVTIVRYEDIVDGAYDLSTLYDFLDMSDAQNLPAVNFNRKSIQKWKTDPDFDVCLTDETRRIAELYGYQGEELSDKVGATRFFIRRLRTFKSYVKSRVPLPIKQAINGLRKKKY